MSVQYFADASQNLTCPTVTALLPAFTVAVSVTTLPAPTVVTVVPPDVNASATVVGVEADAQIPPPIPASNKLWTTMCFNACVVYLDFVLCADWKVIFHSPTNLRDLRSQAVTGKPALNELKGGDNLSCPRNT
jgi:hypothetical protein